jgi:acyl carrier protein
MVSTFEEKDLAIRIAQILISELKLQDITAEEFNSDLDLVDDVGIDSMDFATIVLVLQDEYGIRIDEEDFPQLRNIRLIAEYIKQKLDGKINFSK